MPSKKRCLENSANFRCSELDLQASSQCSQVTGKAISKQDDKLLLACWTVQLILSLIPVLAGSLEMRVILEMNDQKVVG